MRAVDFPSTAGAIGAAVPEGVVDDDDGFGAVVAVVDAVVAGAVVGAPSSTAAKSRSRSFWAWASRRPVPQSWYETKRRMRTPVVMKVRPTAPRNLARRIWGRLSASTPALVAPRSRP